MVRRLFAYCANSGVAAALAGSVVALVPEAASAQDLLSGISDSGKQAVIVSTSGELSPKAHSGNLEAMVAVNGNLSRDGFIIKLSTTIGKYDYLNTSVPGNSVDVQERQFDALIGYQWGLGLLTVAAYVGFDAQDYDHSPKDPDDPVRGHKNGFMAATDIETNYEVPYYVQSSIAYSTAFDYFTSDLRVGYNMKWLVVGVEGAYYTIESSDTERLGGFALFRFYPAPQVPAELTFDAGYQFVEGDEGSGGAQASTSGGEGAYGGAALSVAF